MPSPTLDSSSQFVDMFLALPMQDATYMTIWSGGSSSPRRGPLPWPLGTRARSSAFNHLTVSNLRAARLSGTSCRSTARQIETMDLAAACDELLLIADCMWRAPTARARGREGTFTRSSGSQRRLDHVLLADPFQAHTVGCWADLDFDGCPTLKNTFLASLSLKARWSAPPRPCRPGNALIHRRRRCPRPSRISR